MPLEEGSSDDVISRNIATLVREGKPHDQAIAIAYSKAGRSKKTEKLMKQVFLPIQKVTENPDGTCTVFATAAVEEIDSSREVFDYATGKLAVKKWSDDTLARTNGKSAGNIRGQHNAHVAAGIATGFEFRDADKAIDAQILVTDPVEARKCTTGTYGGLSIGGQYAKRWADESSPGVMRYTPILNEISLCDVPAQPSAVFHLVKLDGTTELRKFAEPPTEALLKQISDHARLMGEAISSVLSKGHESTSRDAAGKWLNKPPGVPKEAQQSTHEISREDQNLAAGENTLQDEMQTEQEKDDTTNPERVIADALIPKAAPAGALSKADTEAGLAKTPSDAVEARRVISAARTHGLDAKAFAQAHAKLLVGFELRKDMYHVARMAELLCAYACLEDCIEREQEYEGDDSKIPNRMKALLADMQQIFVAHAEEESSELIAEEQAEKFAKLMKEVVSMTAAFTELEKVVNAITDEGQKKAVMDQLAVFGKRDETASQILAKAYEELTSVRKGDYKPKDKKKDGDAEDMKDGGADEGAEKMTKADIEELNTGMAKAAVAAAQELTKVQDAKIAGLEKTVTDNQTATTAVLSEQTTKIDKITELMTGFVQKFLDMPAPSKVATTSIEKVQDTGNGAAATTVKPHADSVAAVTGATVTKVNNPEAALAAALASISGRPNRIVLGARSA